MAAARSPSPTLSVRSGAASPAAELPPLPPVVPMVSASLLTEPARLALKALGVAQILIALLALPAANVASNLFALCCGAVLVRAFRDRVTVDDTFLAHATPMTLPGGSGVTLAAGVVASPAAVAAAIGSLTPGGGSGDTRLPARKSRRITTCCCAPMHIHGLAIVTILAGLVEMGGIAVGMWQVLSWRPELLFLNWHSHPTYSTWWEGYLWRYVSLAALAGALVPILHITLAGIIITTYDAFRETSAEFVVAQTTAAQAHAIRAAAVAQKAEAKEASAAQRSWRNLQRAVRSPRSMADVLHAAANAGMLTSSGSFLRAATAIANGGTIDGVPATAASGAGTGASPARAAASSLPSVAEGSAQTYGTKAAAQPSAAAPASPRLASLVALAKDARAAAPAPAPSPAPATRVAAASSATSTPIRVGSHPTTAAPTIAVSPSPSYGQESPDGAVHRVLAETSHVGGGAARSGPPSSSSGFVDVSSGTVVGSGLTRRPSFAQTAPPVERAPSGASGASAASSAAGGGRGMTRVASMVPSAPTPAVHRQGSAFAGLATLLQAPGGGGGGSGWQDLDERIISLTSPAARNPAPRGFGADAGTAGAGAGGLSRKTSFAPGAGPAASASRNGATGSRGAPAASPDLTSGDGGHGAPMPRRSSFVGSSGDTGGVAMGRRRSFVGPTASMPAPAAPAPAPAPAPTPARAPALSMPTASAPQSRTVAPSAAVAGGGMHLQPMSPGEAALGLDPSLMTARSPEEAEIEALLAGGGPSRHAAALPPAPMPSLAEHDGGGGGGGGGGDGDSGGVQYDEDGYIIAQEGSEGYDYDGPGYTVTSGAPASSMGGSGSGGRLHSAHSDGEHTAVHVHAASTVAPAAHYGAAAPDLAAPMGAGTLGFAMESYGTAVPRLQSPPKQRRRSSQASMSGMASPSPAPSSSPLRSGGGGSGRDEGRGTSNPTQAAVARAMVSAPSWIVPPKADRLTLSTRQPSYRNSGGGTGGGGGYA